jgi:hypothetical protein
MQKQESIESIADRSIASMVLAYSGLDFSTFQKFLEWAAEPMREIPGKHQRKIYRQSPDAYALTPTFAGQRVLNLRSRIRNRIPTSIISIGCPAKYARNISGQNIVSALCKEELNQWKMSLRIDK